MKLVLEFIWNYGLVTLLVFVCIFNRHIRILAIIALIMALIMTIRAHIARADMASTWAIIEQTATQTAEHLAQIEKFVEQIQVLQQQSLNLQHILSLAEDAAEGLDGFSAVNDFRNVWLKTQKLTGQIDGIIDDVEDHDSLSVEWKGVFGTLDGWFENADEMFQHIEVADKTNTWSYSIADSYQHLYEQNAEYADQFASNAKLVNEKGALRQIAEELAQLIQLENHNMNLLAQLLKEQSVRNALENDDRRQDLIRVRREGEGVRRFMNMVDGKDFNI
ncbi:MAG: hypothetical protein KKH94_02325 [Candidatus Omnitrophica bacterium]|nr:hypothetical protein [Candidatus Omnitrophota bacterium]